jgi:outer membrane protein assembly factor BamA
MKKEKNMPFFKKVLILIILILCNFAYPLLVFGEESAQDTLKQKRSNLAWLPILYYTPETKIAGGALINYCYRESGSKITNRPSTIMPSFIYTQKKQISSELRVDLYLKNESYNLKGYIGYIKYPDKFYGIGNKNSADMEEDYTSRMIKLRVDFYKKLYSGFYAGIQYQFENSKILKIEGNSLLAQRNICGSEGGTASGCALLMNWDTRNNIFYPSVGSLCQLSAGLFSGVLGSDYDFNRYSLDLRKYFPLFSSHVLVVQSLINITTGSPPFQMLPLLGGTNIMRGYYQGRYRDKKMIVFQTEYRLPLWWRFGLAGFAGFGDVADRVSNFEISAFKYSVGCGLRYQFNPEEKHNLRFDFGFGEGTSGFYITMGEAF